MSRFGLVLALLALLFATASAQVSRQWSRVIQEAPWSPRAGGVAEWYTGTTRDASTGNVVRGPMILMYGVGVWTSFNEQDEARTDVWYSTTYGRTWGQVQVDEPFTPMLSAITVQDSKGRQFRIQGAQAQPPNNGDNPEVWMSSNGGVVWKPQGQTGLPGGERFLGQAVVDSNDVIYVTMGQSSEGALSDVWSSTNQGVRWTRRLVGGTRTSPPPRAVHGSVAGKFRDGTDLIWVMYGWERGSGAPGVGNIYRNDVWVSNTQGGSWVQLLAHAPWTARGDCQIEITDSGVIIVAGGVSSAQGEDKRQLNDVWASLDGGYSWGQCTENAEFTDRQFPFTLLDNQGYLYVMGGVEEEGGSRQVNDVWKSAFSYNDVNEVATRCNLFVPACGVGLKCIPGETGFMQGGWGVSCDACPYSAGSMPTTTATNIMTILFVVFLLLFLATISALIYTYYKMRQSGVTSPIPLPAGAQRWWNSNQETGGLNEGLHGKGATAEDTYSQLSIRDQM